MEILRSNSESLMSVLEAFVHDPLGEWSKGVSQTPVLPNFQKTKSEKDIRAAADRNLDPIQRKLRGLTDEGIIATVPNQVEKLIQSATAAKNLVSPSHILANSQGLMYQGWTAWL